MLTRLSPDGSIFAARRYARDPLLGYQEYLDSGNFPFPVSREKLDRTLAASEVVLVAQLGDAARAYPVGRLAGQAVNDSLGGRRVAVLVNSEGSWAGAYLSTLAGQDLTFRRVGEAYQDEETGSTWDVLGIAVAGPLEGSRLELLPARRAFWFSISLTMPNVEPYLP